MILMTTFNILAWIRARRLKWVGQILRLKDKDKRLIKETLKVIHGHRQAGDILMDTAGDLSWEQLQKMAVDEKGWRTQVEVLKTMAKHTTAPTDSRKKSTVARTATNIKSRFTFKLPASKKEKEAKRKKKMSNEEVRRQNYTKIERKAEAFEKQLNFLL